MHACWLPRICIRGQGSVGCSWGDPRFLLYTGHSHRPWMFFLSEARLQSCELLDSYLPCLSFRLSSTLYHVYSSVVHPLLTHYTYPPRQGITTLKPPLAVLLCTTYPYLSYSLLSFIFVLLQKCRQVQLPPRSMLPPMSMIRPRKMNPLLRMDPLPIPIHD